MRRKFALSASAVLLAVFGSAMVRADITEVLPAETVAVLKFAKLEALNKKIGDFNTKLGIVAFKPEAADPLSMMLAEGGIKKESLDLTGDLAFVFVSGVKETTKDQPPLIVLVPVSDYKAFLANFKDVKTEGDVTEFKGKDDKVNYAAAWGKYAAISPIKDLVAKPGTGMKLPAFSGAQFAEKDVVLWGNIPALRADLLPKMEAHREEFLKGMEEGYKNSTRAQPGAEKLAPMVRAFGSRLMDAAQTFMKESDGSTAGATLTDVGINITVASEFAKDTYLGKVASEIKPVEGSPTVGLPEAKYLVYGGGGSPAAFAQVMKDLSAPIVAELAKLEGGDKAAATSDSLIAMLASAKNNSFGLFAPTGGFGTESLIQVVNVVHADAKAYSAGLKSMTLAMGPMIKSMVPQAAATIPDYEVKDAFKTVDGLSVDRIAVKMNPNPATPEEAQMQQMQKMMYGPEGQFTDLVVINDGLVVVGQATTEANLAKTIAAAKTDTDGPAKLKSLPATRDQLPKSQSVVMYVALDEIVTTGVSYAKGFGLPVNVTLPPDLPPIGVSFGAEGTVIRSDVHIPTALVQSLVAAGMQAFMQMQGGGGGM